MSASNANNTSKAATVEPATKVALVTGSARVDGIGFAAAKGLLVASKNTHVVLTGRSAADGAVVLNELKKHGLTNASYEVLDQTDAKSVDAVLASVYGKHKKIDILVNNAGAGPGFGDAGLATKIEDMSANFEVNTLGPLRLMLAVIPRMQAQGYGRVVNVTSVAGDFKGMDAWAGTMGYRIAKLATNAVGKILAFELKGTGVLVNAYAPGPVETSLMKASVAASAAKGEKFDVTKFGSILTPDQCAKGLVRLATLPVGSEEAGQIVLDR